MKWERAASIVSSELEAKGLLDSVSVVLVGSAARGLNTAESDIDILVLGPVGLPRLQVPASVQILAMTHTHFMQKIRSADDFAQWALRYGRTISDRSGWWENLLQSPNVLVWPSWERKIEQAKARISFGVRLLDTGDCDHAQEEYLLAARHLARGLLLKAGVFPLSQPELPTQLRDVDKGDVADLLDVLIRSPNRSTLARAHEFLVNQVEGLTLSSIPLSARRKRAR